MNRNRSPNSIATKLLITLPTETLLMRLISKFSELYPFNAELCAALHNFDAYLPQIYASLENVI